jgi:hypothetical protein
MATIATMINDSRAGVAAEPLLRFLIRIALALLTALAKKRSIGPQVRMQNQNSTSYTTRHEYQERLWEVGSGSVSCESVYQAQSAFIVRMLEHW